jgi:hypothetical protein
MKMLCPQRLHQSVCQFLIGADVLQLNVFALDTFPGVVELDVDVLATIMQNGILGQGECCRVIHPDDWTWNPDASHLLKQSL